MSTVPIGQLGLWGTSSARRIAVSASFARQEPVPGYIVEFYDLLWAVDGDREKRTVCPIRGLLGVDFILF